MGTVSGYLHGSYAESLSAFGSPVLLPTSLGWILRRQIPETEFSDAMGCYPIFTCRNWSTLYDDLKQLGEELVCLSLVSDPFGDYDFDYLRRCFPDVTIPFKEHFIVDLSQLPDAFVHDHHRRNARLAFRQVEVAKCDSPIDYLDAWLNLYDNLIARHDIKGIPVFSRESFAKQFTVPGLTAFRAETGGKTVGMLLWYAQENRAYYHLGAYSPLGYEQRASFALFRYSLDYFARQGLEWLNLGAGAGVGSDKETGLTRFKRGWSTGTRTTYFCGHISKPKEYQQIVMARGMPQTTYFPAYRLGEFS